LRYITASHYFGDLRNRAIQGYAPDLYQLGDFMKTLAKRWAMMFVLVIAGVTHVSAQSSGLASGLQARQAFAQNVQHQLSQKGFAAQVVLQGANESTLRVQAPGLTPGAIYSVVSSPELDRSARRSGLKTIVFAKESRGRWDYDVERESMLWQPTLF
jgi:hypothetical protein